MIFSFQQRSYKKKNGTQAIRHRFFTSANDSQFIDTKVSVTKSQWDPNKQLVKKHPLEENLNASLQSLISELKRIHYKNPGTTAKRLLQIYKNTKKYDTSSFLDFFQSIIDEMILKGKTRYAKTTQIYHNKLKGFSSQIAFSDLSVQWAKEYEIYLLEKGNATNTIASNFKSIYATLNKAVKAGIIDKNPIKGFEITIENTEKTSLTYNEIQKIIGFEIHPRFKGMTTARDMFLFSFYTAGMRFTDLCKLKWENIVDNEILYTMNKSKSRVGSRRTIPLVADASTIIEKYKGKNSVFVFPPLYGYEESNNVEIEYRIYIRNNSLNRSLKQIDKHLKIGKGLSMHMAKHSFASFAVKNKIGLLMISKLLGHTKLATTQFYLKDFYQEEEFDALNTLFKKQ